MERFVGEDSFWQLFPGASFGVVVARGMKPAGELERDLRFCITQGGDSFLPLGEDAQCDPTLVGELANLDEADAVCRR